MPVPLLGFINPEFKKGRLGHHQLTPGSIDSQDVSIHQKSLCGEGVTGAAFLRP